MVAHHHINTTTWRGLAFTLLWLLASHISKGQKEYQHSPRTGYLSVNGSQLYYETIGHGPALLLLHAGMMNSRMWQHQQHHFARDRFVIVCDLRGYGKTVDSTASYAMCDGIKALLDTLRITKADVVGASIGSIVATELALHYPSYIRKLVLVSPGLKGFQQNLPADSLLQKNGRLMQEAYLVQKDTVRTAEYFIRSWFDGPHRKPGEVNPVERQKALSMAIDKARRGFAYGPVFDSLPVLPRLQGLHKPLLVIIGQYDHTIIKAIGDTLRATVPHCQLKQLPKTAHLGNMERPRAFNAMLRRFLQ